LKKGNNRFIIYSGGNALLKTLRNKKKDKKERDEKRFVTGFLKRIEQEHDYIAEEIEAARPKIREMSTMKPEDALRRLTI